MSNIILRDLTNYSVAYDCSIEAGKIVGGNLGSLGLSFSLSFTTINATDKRLANNFVIGGDAIINQPINQIVSG
jgi:hypothetical protein